MAARFACKEGIQLLESSLVVLSGLSIRACMNLVRRRDTRRVSCAPRSVFSTTSVTGVGWPWRRDLHVKRVVKCCRAALWCYLASPTESVPNSCARGTLDASVALLGRFSVRQASGAESSTAANPHLASSAIPDTTRLITNLNQKTWVGTYRGLYSGAYAEAYAPSSRPPIMSPAERHLPLPYNL